MILYEQVTRRNPAALLRHVSESTDLVVTFPKKSRWCGEVTKSVQFEQRRQESNNKLYQKGKFEDWS